MVTTFLIRQQARTIKKLMVEKTRYAAESAEAQRRFREATEEVA